MKISKAKPSFELPPSAPQCVIEELSRCKSVEDYIRVRRNAEDAIAGLPAEDRLAIIRCLNDRIDAADVDSLPSASIRERIGRLRERARRVATSLGQGDPVVESPTLVSAEGCESVAWDGTLDALRQAAARGGGKASIAGDCGTPVSAWKIEFSALELP